MKRPFLPAITGVIVLFLLSVAGFAQPGGRMAMPDSATYDQMKRAGRFSQGLNFVQPQTGTVAPLKTIVQPSTQTTPAANCNCILAIDNTWQVVPFAFGTPPDYRNDDGSSPAVVLPFNFCFYGQPQSTVFINNNGNISFGASYGAFSSTGFPSNQYVMIAPFWADVDTRNMASGVVYYKVTSTYLVVRWQTVGYYSMHSDKLNDFQLIISDGADPILPAGSNIGFCYGDMQWTTGDASMGTNGFGGSPATVGANRGDGVNYMQLGMFDQAGSAYDGPFGNPDGIDWLDNQQFFFDACSVGISNNVPPVMQAPQVCDTLVLCVGDTLPITANFLSPEQGQITTATITPTPGLTVTSNVSGNIATINAIFVGMTANIGYNSITVSGTDNGSPARTTSGVIVIKVIPGPTAQFTSTSICPGGTMPFTDGSLTNPGNGSLLTWGWNFGDPGSGAGNTSATQNPSHNYATSGSYSVILTVVDSIGCKDADTAQVTVYPLPTVAFTSNTTSGCAPLCVNFNDQSSVPSSTITEWFWNFSDGGTDTLQNAVHCFQNQGDYTIILSVTSQEGCTNTDSIPQMIHVIPGPQANFTLGPQPATITDPTIYFSDYTTGGPSYWLWDFGDPASSSNSSGTPSPSHIYSDTGSFCVQLIVAGVNGTCPDTMVQCLEILPDVNIWIPNAFTPNNNGINDEFKPVFSDALAIDEYELKVFDRWGNLIFESKDPSLGWNGKVQNSTKKAQIDTYVYTLRVTDKYIGKEYSFVGHVNVVR